MAWVWVGDGAAGGGGVSGGGKALRKTFSAADITLGVASIGTVPGGSIITQSSVRIDTAFSVGVLCSIGTVADNSSLAANDTNRLHEPEEYVSLHSESVTGDTAYNLYISGVSALGAGEVTLVYAEEA